MTALINLPPTPEDLTPIPYPPLPLCVSCGLDLEINEYGYCTHCQLLETRWLLERRAERDHQRRARTRQALGEALVTPVLLLAGLLGMNLRGGVRWPLA